MFPSIFYRRGIQSARDSAQFSVYHKGVLVVDLAGGYADDEAGWTMGKDSLIVTASTIKAVSAFCIALLVDRYGRNGTGHLVAILGTNILVYSHLCHNENKHEYVLLQCVTCVARDHYRCGLDQWEEALVCYYDTIMTMVSLADAIPGMILWTGCTFAMQHIGKL